MSSQVEMLGSEEGLKKYIRTWAHRWHFRLRTRVQKVARCDWRKSRGRYCAVPLAVEWTH